MNNNSQLNSLRRVISGGWTGFLTAVLFAAVNIINSSQPMLLISLIWVALYGSAYWYGADHDAQWWEETKKDGLGPEDVLMTIMLLFGFIAMPLILQQKISDGDPTVSVRLLFVCLVVLQLIDLIGRIQLWRLAGKLPEASFVRKFMQRPGHFIRVGTSVVITAGVAAVYHVFAKSPGLGDPAAWPFLATHTIIFAWLPISEVVIWKWRRKTVVDLARYPQGTCVCGRQLPRA